MTILDTHQKTAQLTDAFHLFNALSQQLTESYQCLEAQVSKLTQELAAARHERLNTLLEKEQLAQRLELILAALPAAVVVLNADELIVDCNTLAIAFLGATVVGQHWSDVLTTQLTPIAQSPHEWQLPTGQCVSLQRTRSEDVSGQIIVLTDVTEMRHLQASLNQQQHLSAMGEMVASLAHQVRTPLSTAILYTSQLHKVGLSEEKRASFALKIMERLQHLDRHVNDMLLFAKDGYISLATVELTDLLAALNEQMAEYTRTGRLQFVVTNLAGRAKLLGNGRALEGALLNLLCNAVEALEGEGRIFLTVWQADIHLFIEVKDDGPGMDAGMTNKIFEPFYTTKAQGTGLGLAVVERVFKAHGGTVKCEAAVGQGATFTLSLPFLGLAIFDKPLLDKPIPPELLLPEDRYATL